MPVRHLFLRAVTCVAFAAPLLSSAAEPFDEGRLEKEVLVTGLRDSVQLQVAPNGDVYFIERAGPVKVYSPALKSTRTIANIPIAPIAESHMTGLALDPDFTTNGWIYLYYSPKDPGDVMRLSRFTLREGSLDLSSEKILLTIPFMPSGHSGGGMQFDPAGNLWLSIGDNAAANVTPETDERPGRENYNALGTAANTQDLRGKILRLRPQADGTYTVPPGNLFAKPTDGRPEIYVMGCRNPYRFYYDAPGGTLYWGEVGSNTEERFGTGGYDEISRTTAPANSGWPLFIGPNTPYRRYDHATKTLGDFYSVEKPVNDSRLNTGLRELPPPLPAFIWYGSEDSKEFPELGNGGRSAMVGFRYRYDPALASPIKLPAHFDGRLFIYEWCRNWIKTVTFDAQGAMTGIQPFMGQSLFRRPIDFKLGPDGAIYLIEYGEKWAGNTDGVLSRIVYRRGNRPPVAVATADIAAGRAPLTVNFSAASSSDPDGDALTYRWDFGPAKATASGSDATFTYAERGLFNALLTVTDAAGLTQTSIVKIAVGNAAPDVRLAQPALAGFFSWGEKFPLRVTASDAEDGIIDPAAVRVRWEFREKLSADSDVPELGFEGGAALMRKSDCLSCHAVGTASVGPSFLQISERYAGDRTAVIKLAEKILQGGAGAWGEIPMAPHPQLSAADLTAMAETILAFRRNAGAQLLTGATTEVTTAPKALTAGGGTYVLTATYTDRGAAGLPPLTTETRAVFHSRRKRAALFDDSRGVSVMEVATLVRQRRICVQFSPGSHIAFRSVNLAGIDRLKLEVSASTDHGGVIEVRAGSPTGPLVATAEVPVTGQWDLWKTLTVPVRDPGGTHDLYLVAQKGNAPAGKKFNLDVLEFVRTAPAR